jgi:uridine kinase
MNQEDFSELVRRVKKLDEPCVIAIDGRCGSGKTTLGNKLAEIWQADILHMDDFYLRKEQRTEERYRTPGENVDHERVEEYLKNWQKGKPFTWQKFDHRILEPGEVFLKYPRKKLVVEGSYSMHPDLRKYYDLTVFVSCSEETRYKRLKARNVQNYSMFVKRWIPLEELYFNTMNIEESCDFVFNGDDT